MSTLSVFGICCVSPPPTPPTGGDVSVLFIPDSIKLNNYLVVLFLALLLPDNIRLNSYLVFTAKTLKEFRVLSVLVVLFLALLGFKAGYLNPKGWDNYRK